MKIALGILIIFSSFSYGYDFNLNNESSINDLMYLPKEKTFAAIFATSFSRSDLDYEYNSRNLFSIKAIENDIDLKIGYTISEKTMLLLRIENAFSNKSDVTYGPASTTPNTVKSYKSDSMKDPYIGFKNRLTTQSENNFNQDISLIFSPKIKNNIDATQTIKGNSYRGGTLIDFTYEAGKKYTDQQWKFGATVDFLGKKKSINAGDSSKVNEYDSQLDYSLQFLWQWTVEKNFLVNLKGLASFIDETNAVNTGDNKKVNIDSYSVVGLGADVIFYPIKSTSFQLSLDYGAIGDANYKETTISTGSVTNVVIKNAKNTTYSFMVNHEF